jgi:hypothetical protein
VREELGPSTFNVNCDETDRLGVSASSRIILIGYWRGTRAYTRFELCMTHFYIIPAVGTQNN